MAMGLPTLSLSHTIRASSVDRAQRLSYNPHRTYPKKPDPVAVPSSSTLNQPTPKLSISDLLKRDIPKSVNVESASTYLGYETWLPNAPKVEKPRSVFNPASLAYIGDCIYELYARRHFLFPPLNIEEYNDRVMAVVRCEAQDAMLQKLMTDNVLSQEESFIRNQPFINSFIISDDVLYHTSKFLIASHLPSRDVLRWGKNIVSSKTRTKKRAGVAVYNRASSLETLVGYLYLTNVDRLKEIMEKLGFSTETTKLPE